MPEPGSSAELYHPFVVERHRIWERRLAGLPAPWSADPVLRAKKFTNVFRALDAGTQFLIRELLDDDPHTTLMRCWLYRYTNRPEPWIAFREGHGRYPDYSDLKSGELHTYWAWYQQRVGGIFGPAYQMFVGKENAGSTRLDWALRFTVETFCGSGAGLIDRYVESSSMEERVTMLQELPRCGPFMAMQITTDYGYSRHAQADENEFILAGPGARAGVKAFNGERDAEQVIRDVTEAWRLGGKVTLFGRPPSLMDVQNTFCEFSKYVRAHRAVQIAGPEKGLGYRGHGELPWPVLPQHWELNA